MGGEGHMLDMIRRLKDGKEASRLRRERRNDKLGRLRRNNDPYLLPDTTPEEMERTIKDSGYFYQTVIETNGETIF